MTEIAEITPPGVEVDIRRTAASCIRLFVASLLLVPQAVWANPSVGQVVAGAASISSAGSTLTVKQFSNLAILNWRDFSIAQGELTQFIQPSSLSAALNRVTGGNPSAIYGTLVANGRIYLINPNGVTVGPTGVINAQSFIASTLDVANAPFLSGGALTFSGASLAGVSNQGKIYAQGGDILLIANSVVNTGSLSAPNGTVGLAAGSQVLYQPGGTESVFVQAGSGAAAVGVDQQGQIAAATAELKAAGGNVYGIAVNNGGAVDAAGVSSQGGRIYLTADDGNVALRSGSSLDASGANGGGSVFVGGGLHGADASVADAANVTVARGASIKADAVTSGNGGQVYVWAKQTTDFAGDISARGGASGGNGGFVEVSGKGQLAYRGSADLRAPKGALGTLLLDPADLVISNDPTSAVNVGANTAPDGTATPSALNAGDLQTQLGSANVVVQTGGDAAAGNGDITVAAPVSWSNGSSLSLQAAGNLTVNSPIANTGNGSLSLINASGNMAVNASLTAPSLSVNAATSGNGSLGFGSGVTVAADQQSFQAGIGDGSQSAASADLVTNAPAFVSFSGAAAPQVFVLRQDASIADANIPAAAQFTNGIPAAYTLQSDGGDVTVATGGNVTGSALTLTAQGSVNINDPLSQASLNATANSGSINVDANVTTSGDQNYNGGVLVANSPVLTANDDGSGNGFINFNGSVSASDGGSLATNSAQDTNFFGQVSGIDVLTAQAGGSLSFSQVDANQVSASAGSQINFNGDVGDAMNTASIIATTASGDINVNGNLTANTVALHSGTSGTGNVILQNVTISADNQSYQAGIGDGSQSSAYVDLVSNEPVFQSFDGSGAPQSFVLRQDASIADANIPQDGQFNNGAPPNYTLQSDGGDVTIQTGGNVAGSALTLNAFGSVNINDNLDQASLNATAPNINVGGDVTTSGAQSYNGAVTINNTLTLTGDAVGFGSTLDDGSGSDNLTINAANGVTFGGTVGGNQAFNALTVNGGSGPIAFNGAQNGSLWIGGPTNLTTDGGVAFAGSVDDANGGDGLSVTAGAGGVTFGGPVGGISSLGSLSVTSAGPISINGGMVQTSGGGQTYDGPLVISDDQNGQNTSLSDNGGGAIGFGSTIDGTTPGNGTLNVRADGGISFGGSVGQTTPLASLFAQSNGPIALVPGFQLNATADVSDAGGSLPSAASLLVGANSITIDNPVSQATDLILYANDSFNLNNTVSLNSLTGFGTANLNGGSVQTTGDQTYHGPMILGGPTTLAGGNISLSRVSADGGDLTLTNSGVATLNGRISGVGALTADGEGALAINRRISAGSLTDGEATTIRGGWITTEGDQTYTGRLALARNTTLQGSNLSIGDVDARWNNFTLNAAQDVALNGAVGRARELAANAGGSIDVNGDLAARSVALHAGASGAGNLVLGEVSVAADRQSYQAGVGDGSQSAAFVDLVTNSPSLTGLNGDEAAPQSFVLRQDASIAAAGVPQAAQFMSGAPARFTLQSDGGDLAIGAGAGVAGSVLTLSALGKVSIGGGISPASLDASGALLQLGADVTTAGDQNYRGPLALTADARLTAGGNIDLSSVDGGFNLRTNSAGDTVIGGAVGSVTPLASLDADAGGKIQLDGGSVRTVATQAYRSRVVLTNDTTLKTQDGNVTLAAPVDGGGNALTVDAGQGDVAWSDVLSGGDISLLGSRVLMNGDIDSIGNVGVLIAAAASFQNLGGNMINTAAPGRFLIYSVSPGADVFGPLTGAKQYATTYAGGPAPSFSGSGFLFSAPAPAPAQTQTRSIFQDFLATTQPVNTNVNGGGGSVAQNGGDSSNGGSDSGDLKDAVGSPSNSSSSGSTDDTSSQDGAKDQQ